jgi:hypothetical protein
MLNIQCTSIDEFKAVKKIIDDFQLLQTDYQRSEPFFIKINPKELKVEFLMSPQELLDCLNKSEKLLYKYGFFKMFYQESGYNPEIEYFLLHFYPAFKGLMLGSISKGSPVIDISFSEEDDQHKPDIREGLRFREAYKEGIEENTSENNPINYERYKLFSADSNEYSSIASHQDSIHVNKHREYSLVSDQAKWINHTKI